MIFAFLFAYFGYKKANISGRSGLLWALVMFVAYIGTQFIIGLLIGLVFVVAMLFTGGDEMDYDKYELLFNIIGIVAALFVGFLLLKYLDKVPEEETNVPPPPTDFDIS